MKLFREWIQYSPDNKYGFSYTYRYKTEECTSVPIDKLYFAFLMNIYNVLKGSEMNLLEQVRVSDMDIRIVCKEDFLSFITFDFEFPTNYFENYKWDDFELTLDDEVLNTIFEEYKVSSFKVVLSKIGLMNYTLRERANDNSLDYVTRITSKANSVQTSYSTKHFIKTVNSIMGWTPQTTELFCDFAFKEWKGDKKYIISLITDALNEENMLNDPLI